MLEIRRRPNRVILIMDDRTGRLEVSLYDEVFQQHRDIIVKDAVLVVEGTLRFDDFIEAWRLQAKSMMDIDRARERFARRLWVRWPAAFDGPTGMTRFEELLKPGHLIINDLLLCFQLGFKDHISILIAHQRD